MKHILKSFAAGVAVLAGISTAHAADAWHHGVVEAKGDAGIQFMPTKFAGKFDLDLKTVEFASSTVPVKALLAGEIDSYATTPLTAIAAMAEGADLKFLGCNWPGMTYDLYARGDIKSVRDLKGRTVGISGPGGAPDLFAREALRWGGVDPSEVTFANAGGGGDRFRAVVAGVVDSTATSSEFEPEAAERGVNVIARAPEATPNLLRICIVTSDKVIAEKHDQLVRFLAAQMVGHKYAIENPKETADYARQIAKLSPDDKTPEFIYDEVVKYDAVKPDLPIMADKLLWNVDMMHRNGRIKEAYDIKQFIDEGPRQDALKLVATN
ncbi:ABC transporter substrate-binding protein (plasmid) [Sinorhizobium meliloti]|uniref:ABC transporter substrate-binding protein n=1 Tax=Rhizobium meliloti TaxID=382 RepID=UPI002D7797BB|nr:ABC transporter substrate-binding protein [Sinorhizobium meliloti]WRQ70153.1 ABC transporter substrate-binding protein [Sinorhizobium meliloti]